MRALLLAVTALLFAPAAAGAAWPAVGGGPVNPGSADLAGSFTASAGGVAHVGWTQEGTVRVAKRVGDAWTALPGPPRATSAYGAVLGGLVAVDTTLWAVWAESDGDAFDVVAAGFDGTQWSAAIRLDDDVAGDAFDPTLAVVGGAPHAAWTERDGGSDQSVRVKRFTLGAWTSVGGPVTHDPTLGAFAPSIADVGGVPHVVYTQFEEANLANGLRVAKLASGAWTDVGGIVNDTALLPYHATIASVGGQPAVAWADVSDAPFARTTRVARFASGAWSALGGVVATSGDVSGARYSLREYGGVPHLGYSTSTRAVVAALSGSAWSTVDGPLNASGGSITRWPHLSELGGAPFVTWTETPTNDDFPDPVAIYAAARKPDAVRLAAATAAVAEGGGSIDLEVLREGASGEDVTVGYAVGSGSASAGLDFTPSSGQLTFAPGETSKTVPVPILDDELREGPETFTLTLGVPTGDAVLGTPSQQTVTIIDDDDVDTVISFGPQGFTTVTTVDFIFAANPDGLALACSMDGATAAPCTSPKTYAGLAEGEHTFTVRADGDPTPATRTFFVDSIRPTATAALAGRQTAAGDYVGAVTLTATGADGGSGVAETRCAADPPRVPNTASELGACPVTITAPGVHTVYAGAIDKAGNAAIPAQVTFRILPAPDTTITSGPEGTTYDTTPSFSFASTVAGSTFRCRLDGGAWQACSSPYTAPLLPPGGHSFEVAAVSPEAVEDATPASRAFTIPAPETREERCTDDGAAAIARGRPQSEGPACAMTLGACPGGKVRCVRQGASCPVGATCEHALTVTFAEKDPNAEWSCATDSRYVPGGPSDWVNGQMRTTTAGGGTCKHTTSTAIVGNGRQLQHLCRVQYSYSNPFQPTAYGPDADRKLTCEASLTITPSAALDTGVFGTTATVSVPGPGSLTVSPGGSGRLARASAKRKPLFTPVTVTTAESGPVDVKLVLSKAAKRALKRRGRLALPVRETFTPQGGGTPVTRSHRLALRRPVRRLSVAAVQRRICRKTKRARKAPLCRRLRK